MLGNWSTPDGHSAMVHPLGSWYTPCIYYDRGVCSLSESCTSAHTALWEQPFIKQDPTWSTDSCHCLRSA